MQRKGSIMVLGASENPTRYSNRAVRALVERGYDVRPVGRKAGEIEGLPIRTDWPENGEVDTLTMYLGEAHQIPLHQQVLDLHPRRIIFNPGAENRELLDQAQEAGIEVLEACTLVMLATGEF